MILDQYDQYLFESYIKFKNLLSKVFPTNCHNLYEFLIDILYIKMNLIRAQAGVSISTCNLQF
jgi:hypothetical protein